jgi:hypothetical protein
MPVMFLSANHFAWHIIINTYMFDVAGYSSILRINKPIVNKINIKLFVCKIVLRVLSYDIVNIRNPLKCKEHVLNTD